MARNSSDGISVAITGLACRLPGDGSSLGRFWDSICNSTSAWSEIPRDRFQPDAFHASMAKGGHFLKEDISLFDAPFFGISHSEARAMDPQQRLMAEVVYEALEAAGYPLADLAGTAAGVFMGQFTSDYKELVCRDAETALPFSMTGLQATSLSNRISWLFDLRGPSFTVDTACSSSLVALHLACQSLRSGESDLAIVGGCNLMINPDMFIFQTAQGFLSPDGKCKTFDASADGYGRGEGFAVLVLKRVGDAVSNRDPIRAVIRGTGSNQDGHTKGFTLPSAEAQASLIRDVYRLAGLDFGQTAYVEAHGTGTKAGDLAETTALARTISASLPSGRELIVGSVKSNIGHLEAAAGLAGVVKSVMMLESGIIPPNIHLRNRNPDIMFDEWKLRIPTAVMPWPTDGLRRISINSFGYGGSNAHAILDDSHSYLSGRRHQDNINSVRTSELGRQTMTFPNGTSKSAGNGLRAAAYLLFAISSQDKDGIERVKQRLAAFLASKAAQLQTIQETDAYLADLAFTLNTRRSHLQWKTFSIASSPDELLDALTSTEPTTTPTPRMSSRKPRLGFIFTGQGAQWAGMGQELLRHAPFRTSVAAADTFLRTQLSSPWTASEELQKGKSGSRVGTAALGQALCTVLQVALVDLLRAWGVRPLAVVGHSSGEIAAAYCAGILRREDAWRVAYFRGVVAARLREGAEAVDGAMMAVGASEVDAAEMIRRSGLEGEVHVACVNSPRSITMSGGVDGVDRLCDALQAENVFARKLQVDTAYHSPHMELVAQEYFEAIADVSVNPRVGDSIMYSSVSGGAAEPSELGPAYWVRNLISPVLFASAVQHLAHNDFPADADCGGEDCAAVDVLVEVGPHSALQGPTTQSLQAIGLPDIPYHSILTRHRSGDETALELAGNLFVRGYPVDFREINQSAPNCKTLVDLPVYPWNHTQANWAESRLSSEYRLRETLRASFLGAPTPTLVAGESVWRGHIRLSREPWIADHEIQGTVLYPAAGFLAMAIEAALSSAEAGRRVARLRLRDIHLTTALVVAEEADVEYSVCLRPHLSANRETSSLWAEFVVSSCQDGKALERNCLGLIMVEYGLSDADSARAKDEDEGVAMLYRDTTEVCKTTVRAEQFYRDLAAVGLQYGPAFRNLTEVRTAPGRSCCVVDIPDVGFRLGLHQRPHVIHPGTLDAIFHMAFAALRGTSGSCNSIAQAMVPKSIDDVLISTDLPYHAGTQLRGISSAARHGLKEILADMTVVNGPKNYPVLQISGLCCTEIAGASNGEQYGSNAARSICSKLIWRPAIDLLGLEEQRNVISKAVNNTLQSQKKLQSIDSTKSIAAALSELINIVHHSKPGLAILDVVTTADKTQPFLPDLHVTDALKTANYTILAPDEKTKPIAQDACRGLESVRIELRDISQTLSNQEGTMLQPGDLIILPAVYPTTEQFKRALQNARQLLTSDGRLCLIVPAYQAEDTEASGRAAGLSDWIRINDFEDVHEQKLVLLIGSNTTVTANGTHHHGEVIILQPPTPSLEAAELAVLLEESLSSLGYLPSPLSWVSDPALFEGKACISLLEADRPVLHELTEDGFARAKKLVLGSAKLLWVSGLDDPGSAVAAGLARVVRNEEPGRAFHTLNADFADAGPEVLCRLILRVFCGGGGDNEFRVVGGVTQVSRVVEDDEMNAELDGIDPAKDKIEIGEVAVGEAGMPLKLCVRNVGLLDSLCFEADFLSGAELGDDEVEITVKATSLNFRDVMTVMGQLPGMELGFDAAGIVRRVGPAVSKFGIGDRVVMFSPGAHRTIHRAKADFCQSIPDGLTLEEAATIPLVHGTAWYALVPLARARGGQSILIHAAAGGVGQAAIQIAQHLGMEIFATVGSDVKRSLLRERYGIPDNQIFGSRGLAFADEVRRATSGRGVDVILNSLSGEALRQTWQCIAPSGCFIEIGARDILANARLDMAPFLRGATFTSFDLKRVAQESAEVMADIMQGVFDLQRKGITKPVTPIITFPAGEVENAFRLMQTGKHVGKIVLSFADDQIIPVVLDQRNHSPLNLDPAAAYVLAGGLGGLGRSLAGMLADNGARKLCFLSRTRSNASHPSAQELVLDLQSRGVQVLVQCCDVSSADAVRTAMDSCAEQLGAVRGVVQCAMVLRDTLFRNMGFADWAESMRPKVQGTWNLHRALPDVDFFVVLSSFTAIYGNRGQSNYAAGGAYQDAVAHFRRSRGLRGVTVDVSVVRDVGVVAEKGVTNTLRDLEIPYGLREREFVDLIRLAVAGDVAGSAPPQILTGLATGGSAVAGGFEVPWYLDDPKFSIMARTGVAEALEKGGAAGQQEGSVQARLSVAKNLDDAAVVVMGALVDRVAKMLQTTVGEIDTDRFLHSYGIDSLVAIEVVNWALKECEAKMTVFDVMATVPISATAKKIAANSSLLSKDLARG